MVLSRGFFGKLPARGDFVRTGLPRGFISRWDAWLSAVLPAALQATGDGWLQAPAWRFCLAPGICGADAVAGVLLPSTDKVGRRFPLTLAWLGDGIDAEALASAERQGHATIDEMLSPDQLADRLGAITAATVQQAPELGGLWWSPADGREPLLLPGLPDAGRFATMMTGDVHDC
jgi:type VI secretion system ImpM family protein